MSQSLPKILDLLVAITSVLDDVVEDAPEHLRHDVRVAASLSRIVDREVRLGADVRRSEEQEMLMAFGQHADAEWLARRLREGATTEFEHRSLNVLLETTRRDLSIAKPGYEEWEDG